MPLRRSSTVLIVAILGGAGAPPTSVLGGTAGGRGDASGSLTTGIPLAGAAAGQGTGTGSLATAIPIVGTTGGQGSASGALSTGIALAGAAGGSGAAFGALPGASAAQLAGVGDGRGDALGSFGTAIPISGVGRSQGDVAGTLSTAKPLAGVGAGQGSASGALSTGIALAGMAASRGDLFGALAGPAAVQILQPAIGAVVDAIVAHMQALAIMQPTSLGSIVDYLVAHMEGLVPSITSATPFRYSTDLRIEELPEKTCFRRFALDGIDGYDISQEQDGGGVQNVGMADRLARFALTVAYPVGKRAKDLERLIASDAELALRGLARSANWNGTPILRTIARWSIERNRAPGRWFLVVNLTVQYRDQE
jgi:hypothetical protein